MKKKIIISVLVFIIVIIGIGAYYVYDKKYNCCSSEKTKVLRDQIISLINNNKDKEKLAFSLKQNSTFEWDNYYVFGPYTPNTTIENKIGIKSIDIHLIDMSSQEYIILVVFVKGNKMEYMKLPYSAYFINFD